jgi:hypothetical protein
VVIVATAAVVIAAARCRVRNRNHLSRNYQVPESEHRR